MKTTTKAHLAVLGTNFFFAANYTFIKYISPALIRPYALNVARVGGSLILFWIMWLMSKTSARIQKQHIGRFLLCGLTGVAINQTLFIKGITLTSTIHASLLVLATPLVITVIAFWALKERLNLAKGAGLLLGISGAALLVATKESSQHASNYLLGDLLILINSISYGAYFILVKPLMRAYSPLHVIRWVFVFGFLMILPFGWHEASEIPWGQFNATHFLSLFAIVFTGTFLAYYFTAYGLQHLGAGVTGTYIYTQPFFAVLISMIVLSEVLTVQKLLAAALIFSGVYLVNRK
ncbi:DMT family transporter [Chitinophagaceae bacterium LB-8]|uniref:DMT family transporter n=1 Tax=Paraflavisolibacter caeni TaxID=2982496 RepID=A0A9X2XX78_9BACT|nr:DMT family transporter [Paraflavisolibacter caeni]MCU7550725.1 DMT family transporter [Paraflavisolibacter caeni]